MTAAAAKAEVRWSRPCCPEVGELWWVNPLESTGRNHLECSTATFRCPTLLSCLQAHNWALLLLQDLRVRFPRCHGAVPARPGLAPVALRQ